MARDANARAESRLPAAQKLHKGNRGDRRCRKLRRMFGWLSAAAARASCVKRCRRSPSAEKDDGRTLIATSRPKRGSRARYTSPIPPAPSGAGISYGSSFVPEVSAMRAPHYSVRHPLVPSETGKFNCCDQRFHSKPPHRLFASEQISLLKLLVGGVIMTLAARSGHRTIFSD